MLRRRRSTDYTSHFVSLLGCFFEIFSVNSTPASFIVDRQPAVEELESCFARSLRMIVRMLCLLVSMNEKMDNVYSIIEDRVLRKNRVFRGASRWLHHMVA